MWSFIDVIFLWLAIYDVIQAPFRFLFLGKISIENSNQLSFEIQNFKV
jgi:hypothetical protein